MSISVDVRRQVEERARHRCEYCRLPSALQGATFHIDHILAISAGGTDDLDNLAFACPSCNLSKSSRATLLDPDTGCGVELFNPRRDRWADHFRFDGYCVTGLTAMGRAIVGAFDLNTSRYILIRTAEERFGLYPPDDEGT